MINLFIFIVLIILTCKIASLTRKREPRKNIEVSPQDRKKLRKFKFTVLLLWLPVVLLMLDFCLFDKIVTVVVPRFPLAHFLACKVNENIEDWVEGLKAYIPGLHCKLIVWNIKDVFGDKAYAIGAVPHWLRMEDGEPVPAWLQEYCGKVTGRIKVVSIKTACDNWRFLFRSLVKMKLGFYEKWELITIGIISIIVLGPIFKIANGFQKYLIEKRAMEELKEAAKLKDYNGKPIEGREHRLIKEGLEWAKAPDGIIEFAEDIIGDIIISGKTKEEASIKRKIYPKKDIELCLSGIKKEDGGLVRLMVKYEKEGDIPRNELDTASTENMPLTNLILKRWTLMDEATREIEIRKYASGIAMAQLSNKAFSLVDKLITLYSNTDKTDLEKGLIKEKAEEVKSRIAVLREMREIVSGPALG